MGGMMNFRMVLHKRNYEVSYDIFQVSRCAVKSN